MEEHDNKQESLSPDVVSQSSQRSFWRFFEKNFLALSILAAGIMISFSLVYTGGTTVKSGTAQIQRDGQGNARVDVSVDDDPFIGNKNARVVIVEFSDFQCPFCRTFWRDVLPQIKKDYIDTGKAKLVYRDFPLSFHPGAQVAAEGTECADDQGKFWEFHDKIFQEQDKLGQGTVQFAKADVVKWAGQIGLDMAKFNQCLDSGKYKAEVEKDFKDGSTAGVTGTPSLFINGRIVVGAQPYASFKTIIDEELKKSR